MSTLREEVEKYLAQNPLRFHTPLHKGRDKNTAEISHLHDVTEVGNFDNLHHQTGVLLQLSQKVAEVFRCEKAYISTQGTSLANLVMMWVIKDFGKVAIFRSCHKSIYSAVDLFKIDAMFVDDFDQWKNGEPISPKKVEEAFQNGAKTVVFSNPSYYGDMCDLLEIRRIADEFGGMIAVDEAHGSHLYFCGCENELAGGCADIFSGSFHKTLPTFSGSAFLGVGNKALIEKADEGFALLHSTSPLYASLLSIEGVVLERERIEIEYAKWRKLRKKLSISLEKAGVVEVQKEDIAKLVIKSSFPSKLVEMLEKEGIYPEFSDLSRVVFLLSYLDEEQDYARLVSSIVAVEKTLCESGDEDLQKATVELAKASYSPVRKQSYFHIGKRKKLPLHEAVGKVSASNFGLYPPCFFLVARGEEIPPEILELERAGVELFGVENGEVAVWEE